MSSLSGSTLNEFILFNRGGQTFLFAGQIHKIKSATGRTYFFKTNFKVKRDLLWVFSYKIVSKIFT